MEIFVLEGLTRSGPIFDFDCTGRPGKVVIWSISAMSAPSVTSLWSSIIYLEENVEDGLIL